MERPSSVSLKIVRRKKELLTFYLAAEECKRRIIKKDDDDPAELGEEDAEGEEENHEEGGEGVEEKHHLADSCEDAGEADQEINSGSREITDHDVVAGDPKPDYKSSTDTVQVHSINTLTTPPCIDLNGGIQNPDVLSPHPPAALNEEMNGGIPPLSQVSPTAPLALHQSTRPVSSTSPPGFHFSGEMVISGTPNQQPTTFDPLPCNFGETNWSAFPSESASQSLNNSTEYFFGNRQNPNTLTFSNCEQN